MKRERGNMKRSGQRGRGRKRKNGQGRQDDAKERQDSLMMSMQIQLKCNYISVCD